MLFLSARGTLEDRLKGLELGADTTWPPFPPNCWRLRVALRRAGPPVANADDDGALTWPTCARHALRQAQRGASPIALTNKEYALLLFPQPPGERSRSLIASRVGHELDSDTNVV